MMLMAGCCHRGWKCHSMMMIENDTVHLQWRQVVSSMKRSGFFSMMT